MMRMFVHLVAHVCGALARVRVYIACLPYIT